MEKFLRGCMAKKVGGGVLTPKIPPASAPLCTHILSKTLFSRYFSCVALIVLLLYSSKIYRFLYSFNRTYAQVQVLHQQPLFLCSTRGLVCYRILKWVLWLTTITAEDYPDPLTTMSISLSSSALKHVHPKSLLRIRYCCSLVCYLSPTRYLTCFLLSLYNLQVNRT